MIAVFVAAMLQTPTWIKQFELYPPVSTSAALNQSDVDKFKAKSLAKVYRGPGKDEASIDNGLVRLTISLTQPEQILAFGPRGSETAALASVASPKVELNGRIFDLGDPESGLRIFQVQGVLYYKPFEYRGIGGTNPIWPPRGMGLKISYAHPDIPGLYIERRLQMLDGEPTLHQVITLRNGSTFPVNLESLAGNATWPGEAWGGRKLNLLVRPGRVLELPDQWITVSAAGEVIPLRASAWRVIAPWRSFKTVHVTSPDLSAVAKSGAQVVVFNPPNPISWSALPPEDEKLVGDFVAAAKKNKAIPGIKVQLAEIVADPADRTGGPDSPVCWMSLTGRHWRQNALLNWKRLGIEYVELEGALPRSCAKSGHDHQNSVAADLENREASRQFVIAGLGIGIVIKHPDIVPYGPRD